MRAFFVVILLAWTGMHVYVFWRASSVPFIVRHFSRTLRWSVAVILWVSYVTARILDHMGIRFLAQLLELVGADWIGILFLLLVALLAVELVTLFGWLLPQFAPRLRGWALLAGGALSVIALVQGHRAPTVQNYEVRLAGLPPQDDGTVLVLASDFHLGTSLGKDWLAYRIDQIQAQKPDIIVMGGDIFEGDDPSESRLLPSFRRLSAPFGVWGITGNHEFHGGTQGNASLLEASGIHVLHDRWVEARPGLILAGVDDLTSRRRRGETENFVERALAGRPAGVATILVSHSPWQAETAAKLGVGLMLSSHTHGGQIWPFNYVVRLVYPLLAGSYVVDGMPIIVCRGTGTLGTSHALVEAGRDNPNHPACSPRWLGDEFTKTDRILAEGEGIGLAVVCGPLATRSFLTTGNEAGVGSEELVKIRS
jgi:predicted MPP superfamily phosphohydrolase